MFYIKIMLCLLLIFLYSAGTAVSISRYKQESKTEKAIGTVSNSAGYLIFGLIFGIPFTVLFVLSVIFSWDFLLGITFFGFSLLGLSLVTACCNCRIYYNYSKQYFESINFLGIKKRYDYTDITGFSKGKKDAVIYTSKGKIHIDGSADGKEQFLRFAKKQYRKNHNGVTEYMNSGRQVDFFHGNIENPGEFILIFFMILAYIVGGAVWLTIIAFQPTEKSELKKAEIVFSDYKCEDSDLILLTDKVNETDDLISAAESSSLKKWHIYDYKKYTENTGLLLSAAENAESFTVLYKPVTPDDEPDYNHIYSLTGSDGTVYLTIENADAQQRLDFLPILGIFGAFALLLIAFAAFFTHIVRNAPDHPKLMRYLVKESYIIKH